jgi:hypothetical protein
MKSADINSKALTRIATVISAVFHPVFILFYLFLSLTFFTRLFPEIKYSGHLWIILMYIAFNSIILPMVLIFIIERNVLLEGKSERKTPLLIMVVLYLFILFFFYKTGLPFIFSRFVGSIIVGLVVLIILNRFIKISFHTAAFGAVIGLFIQLYYYYPGEIFFILFTTLIISGLVGTARIICQAHSSKEIYWGYVLGLVAVFTISRI